MFISANLNSCLEELRSILGESVPEHVMVDTVIKHNFSLETALNDLLLQQGEFDLILASSEKICLLGFTTS